MQAITRQNEPSCTVVTILHLSDFANKVRDPDNLFYGNNKRNSHSRLAEVGHPFYLLEYRICLS